MGQTTRRPSIWCSKYHFFFIKSCKNLCKNPYIFLYFLYKITKMKIKSFECPKSIRNYAKKNTWNVRPLVNESFIPIPQRTSVLYWRLSNFKIQGKSLLSLYIYSFLSEQEEQKKLFFCVGKNAPLKLSSFKMQMFHNGIRILWKLQLMSFK